MRRIVSAVSAAALTAGLLTVAIVSGSPAGAATQPSRVFAWGLNGKAQLGDGLLTNSSLPVEVQLPAGVSFAQASIGAVHGLALSSTGQVYSWGDNTHGELGNGAPSFSGPQLVPFPAGTVITQVAAGASDSFALTAAGTVYAWGLGTSGQLGLGKKKDAFAPTAVKMPKKLAVRSLATGADHELALTTTGLLYAWGANESGQLGTGSTKAAVHPVKVALPKGVTVTSVAAGYQHSLAITSAGALYAWGDNTDGEVGDGTTTLRKKPVLVPVPAPIASVSAGADTSAAVTTSGTALAWGFNGDGQLGNGSTDNSSTPHQVSLPAGVTASTVVAQQTSMFALATDGSVYAWGANNSGQLGDGQSAAATLPTPVSLPAGTIATSLGSNSVASSIAAVVQASGTPAITLNSSANPASTGQPVTIIATVAPVDGGGGVSFVSDPSATPIAGCTALPLRRVGSAFQASCSTAALSPGTHTITASYSGDELFAAAPTASIDETIAVHAGSVIGWGVNNLGQRGDGTTTTTTAPTNTALPAGTAITAVSAGFAHSLALAATGTVYAWGDDSHGELGIGTTSSTPTTTPIQVSFPTGTAITAIAAGYDDSFALTDTGQIYAWGIDTVGELGTGNTTDVSVPTLVSLPDGVVATAISAGFAHALALTSTGSIYAWGSNSSGQLGDGTADDRSVPDVVHLPAGSAATSVSAGYVHSLAVTTAGQVLAWGDNAAGELGNGTTTTSVLPRLASLPAGTTATSVSAGTATSAAVTADGSAYTWGVGSSGQLGNGGTTSSSLPVRISLTGGTAAIGAEQSSMVGLTSTGALFAWGDNTYGELGNGTTNSSTSPAAVHTPAGKTPIAIGFSAYALTTLAIVQ